MEEITLRAATAADVETLGSIYIDAVQTIGPQCYSTAGIAAWQRWPTDSPDEFRQRVLAGHTLIAEVEGEPAAFAEFTPPDHLDFLYTCGRFARRGLALRGAVLATFIRSFARRLNEGALHGFTSHVVGAQHQNT